MDGRLRILETLYRFDLDVADHGLLIQRAAERHWHKTSPVAFVSGSLNREGGFELMLQASQAGSLARERSLRASMRASPAANLKDCVSAAPVYGSALEAVRHGSLNSQLTVSLIDQMQIADMLGFYSGTCEAGMVALVAFLETRPPRAAAARTREHWLPLAAHLAAAWRLRQRLGAGATAADLVDVVLDRHGRIRDVRTATSSAQRDALSLAVRRRERERSSRAASDGLWPSLIAGRWTLIDHFEFAGQRSVLAIRNTPLGQRLARLTAQEAAALDLARGGAANKEIALSLGRRASSVTRLLQSVTHKLNATLADLIQLLTSGTVRYQDLAFGHTNLSVFSAVAATGAAGWRDLLSEAEGIVVAAAVRGYSNRQISSLRGSSVRTVINQLASAFEKLAIRSRRELLSWHPTHRSP